MEVPKPSSEWIDVGVRKVPPSVESKIPLSTDVRRVVKVVSDLCNGRFVSVMGFWQYEDPETGKWHTVSTRTASVDISSFDPKNPRFIPL